MQNLSHSDVTRILESKRWIFAKTMAWCPHEYTLRKEWTDDVPFEDVVQYIRENGYREKFGKSTFTRYNVGEFKYWTMGFSLPVTKLINRALINAPDTSHLRPPTNGG